MGSPLLEVTQKPAVILALGDGVPEELALALENGLEEEGIPWERRDPETCDAKLSASRAARASRINVGVSLGTFGTALTAVLHHRDLPEDRPLFLLIGDEVNLSALQRLGRNAARLVKGNPFIPDSAVTRNLAENH